MCTDKGACGVVRCSRPSRGRVGYPVPHLPRSPTSRTSSPPPTGSHFDEYIVEFTRFKPRPPPAAAFELPPACKEAAEAAEGRRAGALGSGLAAQLAMLLPAVRMGGGERVWVIWVCGAVD